MGATRNSSRGIAGSAVALSLFVMSVLPTAFAGAQEDDVRLQQALDRPVNLEIPDAPLPDVLEQLGAMTGVRFELDDEVIGRLPYGRQTRMSVTLRDVTLRDALTPMLAPQALRWRTEEGAVRVVVSPALGRMGRRATYDELQLLGTLYSQRLEDGPSVLDQLREQSANPDLKLNVQVPVDEAELIEKADAALPATGARWLNAMCRTEPWTWYVTGDRIVVLPRARQVRRQLNRQVSLRYEEDDLLTVLLDLADKAGVHLAIAPDALNYVPVETRDSFTLIMSDASIAQALEVIGGVTGLALEATDDGLSVSASEELKARVQDRPAHRDGSQPFFVRMSLPGPDGVTFDVLMRADDLPEEVREHIDRLRNEAIERLIEEASR